jgi:hypothetical protein
MPEEVAAKGRRAEMDWEMVARELAQKFGLSQKQVLYETRRALIARVAEGVAINALQGKMVTEEDKEEFRTEVDKAIDRLGVYWSGQWPGYTKKNAPSTTKPG